MGIRVGDLVQHTKGFPNSYTIGLVTLLSGVECRIEYANGTSSIEQKTDLKPVTNAFELWRHQQTEPSLYDVLSHRERVEYYLFIRQWKKWAENYYGNSATFIQFIYTKEDENNNPSQVVVSDMWGDPLKVDFSAPGWSNPEGDCEELLFLNRICLPYKRGMGRFDIKQDNPFPRI